MAQSPQVRVLRCCSCRIFQTHQVKKSLRWTCKVCGEKQSFLRTYGEGSGADCRRHVQKLNLLQGHVSEMSLRSLEETVHANKGKDAGPGHAEHLSLREKLQPSKNRWLKYLQRGSRELGLEGAVCFNRWPSSTTEKPDPPFNTSLPRKRRWNQSMVQPFRNPAGQDSGDYEVTLETQKLALLKGGHGHLLLLSPLHGSSGLVGNVREGNSRDNWDTRELSDPCGEPPDPAQQVRATSSKWERFLLPPGNSSHTDTEPPTPLQRGPRTAQAEQSTPRIQTPREGSLSRTSRALQLPQATHSSTSGSTRPFRGTGSRAEGGPLVRGAQESPLVQLCDLFNTGEDFDDNL